MKNPDQGGLRQKMQYSEDKKSEGEITAEEGEKKETRRKEKNKEKRKTIIKIDQMWSNQRNLKLVKSEKP